MAAFDWDLVLDVERDYLGDLPARLEASGWDYGCGFTGVEVVKGDRLFIATDEMDLSDPRLIGGEIYLWRDVGGGRWAFYGDALQDGRWGSRPPPSAPIRPAKSWPLSAASGRLIPR